MPSIEQQVTRTRNRLWLSLWLEAASKSVAVAAGLLAVGVVVSRLASKSLPWLLIMGGLAGAALIASLAWSWRRRPDYATAATALDQAAGLRERVSSSLFFTNNTDPFAQAVVADARDRADRITVNKHVRLQAPRSARWAGAGVLVAALSFLMPEGLLSRSAAKSKRQEQVAAVQTRITVQKRLDDVKKMAATNPALADLKADLDKLDAMPQTKMDRPEDVRQDALKKIDKLADAVREKKEDTKYDRATETQKMMRALQEPPGPKSDVQKLARDLKQGDFKSAQESIKQLQEQLATLKKDGDKQLAEQMQKQLDDLAKQLEKLGSTEEIQKKLEQAGLKKEDVERMLERLSKEDMEKIRDQLEKSGLTQQQIGRMTEQLQKKQGAAENMQSMAKAMSKAAQSAGQGQGQDAASSLEQANDQLSDLESLEQEKNQLESAMSELNQARGDCSGDGEGKGEGEGEGLGLGLGQNGRGQGDGGGQGSLGRGSGGRGPREQTATAFKIERAKVETTEGKIVGQFLVDGEQIKGEASEEFVELIAAAERDATDSVEKSRIPRQYHKAMREYFARLPGQPKLPPPDAADSNSKTDPDAPPAEGATAPAKDAAPASSNG
jgi:hypothetical protein